MVPAVMDVVEDRGEIKDLLVRLVYSQSVFVNKDEQDTGPS